MKLFAKILILFVLVAGLFSHSDARADINTKSLVKNQMILMGLYVYGINQELAKTVPNLDELNFLADSILNIAEQLHTTKGTQLHHADLNTLLETAQTLKKLTKNKKRAQALTQAQSLINACGQCHKHSNK